VRTKNDSSGIDLRLWSRIFTTSVLRSNLECLGPTGAGHIFPGTTVTEAAEAQLDGYLVVKSSYEKN
jgi:hypothetical protein